MKGMCTEQVNQEKDDLEDEWLLESPFFWSTPSVMALQDSRIKEFKYSINWFWPRMFHNVDGGAYQLLWWYESKSSRFFMMRHRLIEVGIFSRKQGYESKSSKFLMMRHRLIEVGIIIWKQGPTSFFWNRSRYGTHF